MQKIKRLTAAVAIALAFGAMPAKANPAAVAAAATVMGGVYIGYLVGGTLSALIKIERLQHSTDDIDEFNFSRHAVFVGV